MEQRAASAQFPFHFFFFFFHGHVRLSSHSIETSRAPLFRFDLHRREWGQQEWCNFPYCEIAAHLTLTAKYMASRSQGARFDPCYRFKFSFCAAERHSWPKEIYIYMKQHRGNPDVPTYRFIRQPNSQPVRKIKSPLARQWQHFVRTKRSRLQTFFFLESGKWLILTFRRSVSARFIAPSRCSAERSGRSNVTARRRHIG